MKSRGLSVKQVNEAKFLNDLRRDDVVTEFTVTLESLLLGLMT
jgi:hypothetical protein